MTATGDISISSAISCIDDPCACNVRAFKHFRRDVLCHAIKVTVNLPSFPL
ncbi:hypothetical protein THIOM_003944 [Candidatus Thiomargarita nelsonii]|uniref:Uncharacterized protein n=1 Tax=Candidatus Thiomargarita nelsonii TaxID=1003181 RepID=A0A176RX67_9GAMM|nr:hypothetical protein THIOM_003944 [Candidatus Thiomargarita nelsonii]